VDPQLESALYQWRDGERRLLAEPDPLVDDAAWALVDELRRRLGGAFRLDELAALYARGEWAAQFALERVGPARATLVVDVGFARYAREASDFGGGVVRPAHRL